MSTEQQVDEQQSSAPPQGELSEVEQLRVDLSTAQKRVNELAYALQAGERDREEFKQRQARERERMIDVEKGNIAVALLEAVDELDLALHSADASAFATGVKFVRDSLLKRAEALGIERVELAGKPYDPNLAEATDMELTANEAEDGHVSSVLKSCYQLKGRVIRPGTVRVAKFVKPAQA